MIHIDCDWPIFDVIFRKKWQGLMMIDNSLFIQADWPLTDRVLAGTTVSGSPLAKDGFNLAQHVDDDIEHVRYNRRRLLAAMHPQITPMWLSQYHSEKVISAGDYFFGIEADAAISRDSKQMPVVLTADCLPILLTDCQGREVAAVHAGWQGLYRGIIANTIAKMTALPSDIYAWIGPGISQANYEVDEAFYQRFIKLDHELEVYFRATRPLHYLADLSGIAIKQLQLSGLERDKIYNSGLCSFSDKRFFSHRRDGRLSGRMATFIHPYFKRNEI